MTGVMSTDGGNDEDGGDGGDGDSKWRTWRGQI